LRNRRGRPHSNHRLIWQILYPIILVTFGFVFVQTIRRKIRGPWLCRFAIISLQLIFTPIQFGIEEPAPWLRWTPDRFGARIIWMVVAIWRHDRWLRRPRPRISIWCRLRRAATEHHLEQLGKVNCQFR